MVKSADVELGLTANAIEVLRQRYLLKDGNGCIVETPVALFSRVAKAIAQVEGQTGNQDTEVWEEKFYELMSNLRFLPNSPTLMNAGKREGQLSACFVLPVEDSLEGIFETLKSAAKIHQSGGGTGFSFSRLRRKGSAVRSSQGIASGPVSFIRIYDTATETIKQGGTRRGANMAVLRVDHPDILEFIRIKADQKSLTNFNLSVGVTDAFMNAVRTDGVFSLHDSMKSKPAQEVQAKALFREIAKTAWTCGDPGVVFLDRMNRFNPTPQIGLMESTNPCGEQPLLDYESCNLGSLNLGKYFDKKGFDWTLLQQDIRVAVRFLDNVIDANHYPVVDCKKITLGNRKIGLGVMGFADLLLLEGIPYSSPEARAYAERLIGFVDREAKKTSAELAKERGSFPNWTGSLWEKLGYRPLRNATVSTIAPTGTISMIAGASSGIEPIFSGIFYRNVLDGKRLVDIHPSVKNLLGIRGSEEASQLSEKDIAKAIGPAWSPAYSVSVKDHVLMQSIFQRFSDSAVSKTINLPESAEIEDIEEAYWLAFRTGCKGITVYRDKSKPTQVLESGLAVGAQNESDDLCPLC